MSGEKILTKDSLINFQILSLLSNEDLRTVCSIDDNLFNLCDQIWNQRIINNFGRASLNFKNPYRPNQDWYFLLLLESRGQMESDEAARRGYLDFLKWLWTKGAQLGTLEISEAVRNGHLDVVIWLTNLNFKPSIHYVYSALINHYFGVVNYLLDHNVIHKLELTYFLRKTKDTTIKKWALDRRIII